MDSAAPALPPCYRITARDDVAIALRDLAAGERVTLDGAAFELLDAITRSHKFALRSVSAGEPVRKYGQVIGRATAQIAFSWLVRFICSLELQIWLQYKTQCGTQQRF